MPEPIQATTSEPMPTNPPTVVGVSAPSPPEAWRIVSALYALAEYVDSKSGRDRLAQKMVRAHLNDANSPPHPPAAQTPAPPASEPAPTPKAEPKPEEERVRWFRVKNAPKCVWKFFADGRGFFTDDDGTVSVAASSISQISADATLEEFTPDSPAPKDAESVGDDWLPEGMGAIERDGLVRWSSDYVYDRDSQWRGVVREQTRLYGQAVAECLSLRSQLAAMTERAEPEEREPNENKPIGRCPKCQTPVYTDEGFCGGCRAGI